MISIHQGEEEEPRTPPLSTIRLQQPAAPVPHQLTLTFHLARLDLPPNVSEVAANVVCQCNEQVYEVVQTEPILRHHPGISQGLMPEPLPQHPLIGRAAVQQPATLQATSQHPPSQCPATQQTPRQQTSMQQTSMQQTSMQKAEMHEVSVPPPLTQQVPALLDHGHGQHQREFPGLHRVNQEHWRHGSTPQPGMKQGQSSTASSPLGNANAPYAPEVHSAQAFLYRYHTIQTSHPSGGEETNGSTLLLPEALISQMPRGDETIPHGQSVDTQLLQNTSPPLTPQVSHAPPSPSQHGSSDSCLTGSASSTLQVQNNAWTRNKSEESTNSSSWPTITNEAHRQISRFRPAA